MRYTCLIACSIAVLCVTVKAPAGVSYEQAVTSTPGLFAYWRFDDDTGADGSTATDELGANNGTYAGAVPIAAGPDIGMSGNKAADFSGITNYIDAGTLGSLGSSLGGGVTIEMWLKATGTTTQWPLGLWDTSNTSLFVSLDQEPGGSDADNRIRIGGNDNNNDRWLAGVTDDTSITDDTWNYLAVALDMNDDILHVYTADLGDAVSTSWSITGEIDENPSSFLNFLDPVFIGAQSYNGTGQSHFNGLIDELAVYQGVLTKAQLDSHLLTASIPEPGTMLLALLAGLALAAFRARRRR